MTLLESPIKVSPAPADYSARDAYIAGRLVTAYALSEQLSPFGLRVEVRDAIVSVSGTVDDKVQRDLAEEIARDIDDVREVRCAILVEAPAPRVTGTHDRFARRFNDASLAARVRTRLLWNDETHGQAIQVCARDGMVMLSGTVSAPAIRELAGRLVTEVPGVCAVDNQLSASPQ